MVHLRSLKRKNSHHITSSQTNHDIKSTQFSTNAFFTHIIKAISPLRHNHCHLPLRSSPVLKKLKWNTSSTLSVLETQSTTSFIGNDFHTRKMNGFPLRNLPMHKWQSRISIIPTPMPHDLPLKSGKRVLMMPPVLVPSIHEFPFLHLLPSFKCQSARNSKNNTTSMILPISNSHQ